MTQQDRNPNPREQASRRRRMIESLRSVVVTGVISASLLSVMYGVTLHRAAEHRVQHQAQMQHDVQREAAASANVAQPPT